MKAAGLVLVRQRPGTAKGVCFITLEDETGVTNLVIFAGVFEQYRKEILTASVLGAEGKLQSESGVTHVIVIRCFDLSGLLGKARRTGPSDGHSLFRDSGEASSTSKDSRTEVFPAGRNFK